MADTLQIWLGKQDVRLRQYVDKMREQYGMSESQTLKLLLYKTIEGNPMRDELNAIGVDVKEIRRLLEEEKHG